MTQDNISSGRNLLPEFQDELSNTYDDLVSTYLEWTKDQIYEYRKILKTYDEVPVSQMAYERKRRLFIDIIDNMRDLGGSFGYALMTDIALDLLKYLRDLEGRETEISLTLMTAYVEKMAYIIDHKMSGYGGEQGHAILVQLKKMITKEIS